MIRVSTIWERTACSDFPGVFLWNKEIFMNVETEGVIDLIYTKKKNTPGGRFWIQVRGKANSWLKQLLFVTPRLNSWDTTKPRL